VRKRALILLLAASAAWSQAAGRGDAVEDGVEDGLGAAEIKRIEHLVERLAAWDAFARLDAQRQLAAFGRRAIPVLRAFDPEEPEARMRLNEVLRLFERIELTARLVTDTHAVGAPVAIRMSLVNRTRQSYLLQISQGTLTPFRISVAGSARFLKRSEVTFSPEQTREFVTVQPGGSISAEAAISPEDLPRDRTGTIPIVVTYTSRQALRIAPNTEPSTGGATIEGDAVILELSAPTLEIDIRTRTLRQLDRALASPGDRARALVEIRFRADDDILPLLREHAGDPDLRLHAVRTLGAKGDEQDLDMIRRATADRNGAVRKAATLALGNFPHRKARQRLALLARDEELRLPAVQALTKHRCARTIDTFVAVLRHKYREGEWAPVIRKALLEWTGKTVRNTPTEIAAFERWWTANRAEWRKQNER